MDECFICHGYGTERHHIFGGSRRNKSERLGLIVMLCPMCHRIGKDSIHSGYTDLAQSRKEILHQYGQTKAMAEQGWTTEDFIREFGRNYL